MRDSPETAVGWEPSENLPIHNRQLSDHVYQEAQRRAAQAGFPSVDEFVADMLQSGLPEETENFDHLFTPERLAHIARAAAEIDSGQGLTLEQVDAQLAKCRDEWHHQNPR